MGQSVKSSPPDLTVELAWYEMAYAAWIGSIRRILSIKRHSVPRAPWKDDDDTWGINIEGVMGEMAFAKVANRYASLGVDTFKGPDIAGFQVRTCSGKDNKKSLLVRPHDADNDVFVQMIGFDGTYRVGGWLSAREAKRPEWLKDYNNQPPAYFVPPDALHPPGDLLPTIEDKDEHRSH